MLERSSYDHVIKRIIENGVRIMMMSVCVALCVATHCVELCGVTFADGLAFLWFVARALSKLPCFQPNTFLFQKMFQTNHFSISKGYFPSFAHICQKCHVSNQPLTLSYFQMVFLDVRAVALLYCFRSIVRA